MPQVGATENCTAGAGRPSPVVRLSLRRSSVVGAQLPVAIRAMGFVPEGTHVGGVANDLRRWRDGQELAALDRFTMKDVKSERIPNTANRTPLLSCYLTPEA